MKIFRVKIHLDITLKNMTADVEFNASQVFDYTFSHQGHITLAIRTAIEKVSQVLSKDVTNFIDKIEAQEIK